MNTIIFKGRIPSKKNGKRIIQRNGRPFIISSEDYKNWQEAAMYEAISQCPKKKIPVQSITLTFFPENRVRGDLTNKAESLMDLLVDCGILEDDNWFVVSDIHLKLGGVDRENPRAVIEIK